MLKKAFDSVRWSFLYKVLDKIGFHQTGIKTVQSIYNKPTTKMKINISLSKPFTPERSCRQGFPLSLISFALFVEPLRQCVRQDNQIRLINIQGDDQRLSLFADDILIYPGQPNESPPRIMMILEEFRSLSA